MAPTVQSTTPVSTLQVIVQRRGGYTPGIYGPFKSREDADLWVAYRVPNDCDYWIVPRPYEISDQEMERVHAENERDNRRADREDAMALA